MKTILQICFVFWYFNQIVDAGNHRALIFDRKEHSLLYIPKQNISSNPPPGSENWAMACPAKTEEEKQFASTDSFYENNALFVQKTDDGKFFGADLDIEGRCNEPFQLSLAFSKSKLEFGYEVYFESLDMGEFKANTYPFHKYRSMNYILKAGSSLKNLGSAMLHHFLGKFKGIKLELNKNKPMEFLWIPLFKVWFPLLGNQFKKIDYQITKNNINPSLPCENFDLGEEMYDTSIVEFLYSTISGENLQIVAGQHKVLTLRKKSLLSRQFWLSKPVLLEVDSISFKVPKLIYKVVKYKSTQCDQEKKQPCWYGILIVIHNGPYVTKEDLICEDKSGKLGWEEIRYETWSYEGAQSQFIYVCEISKDTMKSIGLEHNNTPIEEFSLIHFPYFNEQKQFSIKNIRGEIFNELKRISDSGKKALFENTEIIERPSMDSVNSDTADNDEIVNRDNESENADAEVTKKK